MLTTDPFALLSDLERHFELASRAPAARSSWRPAIDVIATDRDVRVIADVPGVSREDLAVDLHGGVLTIRGTRRPTDVSGGTAHRIERGWGPWSRSLRLRDGLEMDGIDATLTDGVLTITIPVAEEAKPRRIEIATGVADRELPATA